MREVQMTGETIDITKENIERLKELFPEICTDGKIDFDMLKELLGEEIDKDNERYNFTWNGKSRALRISQSPSTGTLRPCKEESKDWDTTQNLYIEGDNLEVLKLLQKSYHGKIKMIYIDPPYNTGNDFVYKDDFKDNIENYKRITGQVDEEGNKLSTNSETSGRYHTDWLNMMYPRLRLARNLLSDDGVIAISIDDNEYDNLNKQCSETFGELNFIATIVWKKKYGIQNDAKYFSTNHDFILIYAKNIDCYTQNLLPRTKEQDERYTNRDDDPRGPWKSGDLSVGRITEKDRYEIVTPSGRKVMPPNGRSWVVSKDSFEAMVQDNRIWFGENNDNVPSVKKFLSEVKDGRTASTIWEYNEVGHTDKAKKEVNSLFGGKSYFDYPKPVDLIKQICVLTTNNDSIILDFFSGSSTTAHSVMQLNTEDSGNRKFIMVQLPEVLSEKSDAKKDGYNTIADIGKERIRKAGEKIKEERGLEAQNLDIGFKVLKLDSSNIKKWNPDYDNLEESLITMQSNFMEGRTELDVVYEIMLKYGLELTYPVDKIDISGKNIYSIAFGMLVICLDNDITTDIAEGIIEHIQEQKPESARVVFKDNGFKTDSDKANIKEILKQAGIEEIISI